MAFKVKNILDIIRFTLPFLELLKNLLEGNQNDHDNRENEWFQESNSKNKYPLKDRAESQEKR